MKHGSTNKESAQSPTLSVGVVQANIGNIEKEMALRGDMDGIIGTLRRYGELSDRLATRRAQVRATNTGISALILPTGEIVDAGPEDEPAALQYAVPLLDLPATPVVRWGNWPGPMGLVVLGVLMLRARWRRPARSGKTIAHVG